MENCAEMQELISRTLDEELSAEEGAALAKHLEDCPECRAMYQAFAAVSGTLQSDLAEPPEALHENVMAQLRRERIRQTNRRPWRAVLTVAAMAVLVLGIHAAAGNRLVADLTKEVPMTASARQFETAPEMALYSVAESADHDTDAGTAALPVYDLSDRTLDAFLQQLKAPATARSAPMADTAADDGVMQANIAEANGAASSAAGAMAAVPEPWCTVLLSDGEMELCRLENTLWYAPGGSGDFVQTGLNVEQFEALFDGFLT